MNEKLRSKMTNQRSPSQKLLIEGRGNIGSAVSESSHSVQLALSQLDAFGKHIESQENSPREFGSIMEHPLEQNVSQDIIRKSPRLKQGGSPSKKREPLPLATVNIMTGAVTLEHVNRQNNNSPTARSPFVAATPATKTITNVSSGKLDLKVVNKAD